MHRLLSCHSFEEKSSSNADMRMEWDELQAPVTSRAMHYCNTCSGPGGRVYTDGLLNVEIYQEGFWSPDTLLAVTTHRVGVWWGTMHYWWSQHTRRVCGVLSHSVNNHNRPRGCNAWHRCTTKSQNNVTGVCCGLAILLQIKTDPEDVSTDTVLILKSRH